MFSQYRYIFFSAWIGLEMDISLVSAEAQSRSLTSERNLTPLACGILRFLTHAAMLLGADQNFQVC